MGENVFGLIRSVKRKFGTFRIILHFVNSRLPGSENSDISTGMENTPLLLDIEAFLAETGTVATRLGLDALKDASFVSDLRNGRQYLPRTELRVRATMAAIRAEQDAKQGAA